MNAKAFLNALAPYQTFLVTSHIRPEADSIGSALAMGALLEALGKKVTVVCEDAIPERFAVLASPKWRTLREVGQIASPEACVTLDCASLDRLGGVQALFSSNTVLFNVDHHATNTRFGHHNYVHPGAGSAGELVLGLYDASGLKLSADSAACLYAAIATDTQWFRSLQTSADTLEKAARLARHFPLGRLTEGLVNVRTLSQLRLMSRCIERIQISDDHEVAWSYVTCDHFREYGAAYHDLEGFVDFLHQLTDIKIAVFLSELSPGITKVSFRGKQVAPVKELALRLGGGGHLYAAGCVLNGQPLEIVPKILNEISGAKKPAVVSTPQGRHARA